MEWKCSRVKKKNYYFPPPAQEEAALLLCLSAILIVEKIASGFLGGNEVFHSSISCSFPPKSFSPFYYLLLCSNERERKLPSFWDSQFTNTYTFLLSQSKLLNVKRFGRQLCYSVIIPSCISGNVIKKSIIMWCWKLRQKVIFLFWST